MLRCPKSDACMGGGDFGRFAAEANGDDDEANASKPVRFKLCSLGGELARVLAARLFANRGVPSTGLGLAGFAGVVVLALAMPAQGAGFEEKRLGPLTLAKGELTDAYAMKPPPGCGVVGAGF